MPTVKTIHISFSLSITNRQIPQWRGAFVEMAGREYELLHNHNNSDTTGNYHYRYPRIQYRVYKGKASLFALGEGVDTLQEVLKKGDWNIVWEQKKISIRVEKVQVTDWVAEVRSTFTLYEVTDWIPFNQKNIKAWDACKGLVERGQLLERVLTSHLMACCYGIDWKPVERIEVFIQDFKETSVRARGVVHRAFSVLYKTNINLPPYIGIGKSVSIGFGWHLPK